eukprot:777335-Prorocentrum_minimum.AAC.1
MYHPGGVGDGRVGEGAVDVLHLDPQVERVAEGQRAVELRRDGGLAHEQQQVGERVPQLRVVDPPVRGDGERRDQLLARVGGHKRAAARWRAVGQPRGGLCVAGGADPFGHVEAVVFREHPDGGVRDKHVAPERVRHPRRQGVGRQQDLRSETHNAHPPRQIAYERDFNQIGSRITLAISNKSSYNTTQHDTTQHNTTRHNTTQHNTTQRNATQRNATQHDTTQHNTTQRNATQRNTTQRNTRQDKTRQDKTTQRNATQSNTTQHNTTQHNATQHDTTQHNATQHNTTQHGGVTSIKENTLHGRYPRSFDTRSLNLVTRRVQLVRLRGGGEHPEGHGHRLFDGGGGKQRGVDARGDEHRVARLALRASDQRLARHLHGEPVHGGDAVDRHQVALGDFHRRSVERVQQQEDVARARRLVKHGERAVPEVAPRARYRRRARVHHEVLRGDVQGDRRPLRDAPVRPEVGVGDVPVAHVHHHAVARELARVRREERLHLEHVARA